MKKALPILLALSLFFASCGALAAAGEEEQKAAAVLVEKAVTDYELNVEVDRVMPFSGPSKMTNREYYLRIKDGKVWSYLPFIGTATYAPYGSSTNAGINFEGYPIQIRELESRKAKGETKYGFTAVNGNNEEFEIVISFWTNGRAAIYCNARTRSPMNYTGQLVASE